MFGLRPCRDTTHELEFGQNDLPIMKIGVNGGVFRKMASLLDICTSLVKTTFLSTQ